MRITTTNAIACVLASLASPQVVAANVQAPLKMFQVTNEPLFSTWATSARVPPKLSKVGENELLCAAPDWSQYNSYEPKSPLGRTLLELRRKAIMEGLVLRTGDEIDEMISAQRI